MSRAILCGGKPAVNDLRELDDFKAFVLVLSQAKEIGLSRGKALEYACTEVYGDKFGEGNRPKPPEEKP